MDIGLLLLLFLVEKSSHQISTKLVHTRQYHNEYKSKMKTYKVYLNIYDFMSCNGCLETIGVGAFHTGVEVGNTEYCYSVCSSDPEDSGIMEMEPETADYIFNRKLYLGETTLMQYRLNQIIAELSEEFTVGKYHMFSYNCNHFSNELAKRLTNNEVPKFIFRASNILTYLCCCLPSCITNGQYAYSRIMEADQAQREQNQMLLNKWEPLIK